MVPGERDFPVPIQLIAGRSHPLMRALAGSGATIFDCIWLEISPIVFRCNEAWKPVLEIACAKAGYAWEWVADEVWPADYEPGPYSSRWGEAVLTKVE